MEHYCFNNEPLDLWQEPGGPNLDHASSLIVNEVTAEASRIRETVLLICT